MYPNQSNATAANSGRALLQSGLAVGFAGGLAEILWITAYSVPSDVDAALVARGVAAAVGAGGSIAAAPLGIAIHMILAGLLGIVIVAGLRALPVRARSWRLELVIAVGALAGVWAFNFLVFLPVLSPAFITMVPLSVSFISKLLFGLTAFFMFEMRENRLKHQP